MREEYLENKNTAQTEREVVKELDNLSNSLELLGKNLESLAARIHPACNFDIIAKEVEGKNELSSLCPLATSIRERRIFVRELTVKVTTLIDAVQL